MELCLCGVRRLIHSVFSNLFPCTLSLAVSVGHFPPRAASSALSAAPAHSWVRRHVHMMQQALNGPYFTPSTKCCKVGFKCLG